MALCDGRIARPLPLAQDHKRIGEGDSGPNTGGMGAYAPAPVPYPADELCARFVQPVLDHLAAAGTPYVGVLYAGLMLTADGPRLLEFNCRFGDPEAQAVLPLLDGDLAEIALACCTGGLADRPRSGALPVAACTVVAAAGGYPAAPRLGAPIVDLADVVPDDVDQPAAIVFPAGTDGERVTGGRVLAVTGLGADLREARRNAYARLEEISFEGMQVRRDIGWRAVGAGIGSYADAGVDIDEGGRAVEQMRAAVERTHGSAVLHGVGSFGGAFSAKAITAMNDPVLVASTDGVGTKVELAARLGRYRGVGADIVNHCVNDVLVQGARPLFFLDYVAASRIDADADRRDRRRDGRRVRRGRLRAARRGDRGDARRVRARRVRHRRHADRRRRACRPAPADRPAPGRRARRSGLQRSAHQRLLAAAQGVRVAADGRRAGRDGPTARRRAARAASQLPAGARRRAAGRQGQGAGPHHRWRPAGEPAARAARLVRRRRAPRRVADPAAVPPRARGGHRPRRARAVPHAEHGHRHGAGLRRRPTSTPCSGWSPSRRG